MWSSWLVAVLVAAVVQAFLVPRLTVRTLSGEPQPNFSRLGGWWVFPAAGLSALPAWLSTINPDTRWLLLVWAISAPLAVTDLATTYLPNQLMYPLWAALALAVAAQPNLAALGILGGVAAYGGFWLVWRFSGSLGYGDVRLAGAVGLLTSPYGAGGMLLALCAGTVLGAVAAVLAACRGRRVIPYGPWLWLGALAPFVAQAG